MNWNDIAKEIEKMTPEERNGEVYILDKGDYLPTWEIRRDSDFSRSEFVISTAW
jgi:hypothetical protein